MIRHPANQQPAVTDLQLLEDKAMASERWLMMKKSKQLLIYDVISKEWQCDRGQVPMGYQWQWIKLKNSTCQYSPWRFYWIYMTAKSIKWEEYKLKPALVCRESLQAINVDSVGHVCNHMDELGGGLGLPQKLNYSLSMKSASSGKIRHVGAFHIPSRLLTRERWGW